jgi:isoleucyl-tRNA synthetase
MFRKVDEARFIEGEHEILRLWQERSVFQSLLKKNCGLPKWSFLDGPITANNPMGVHHAWGRTYKDAYQRYFAMTGHELRYQNGFDCQGLWVEVEVEKELGLGTKTAIHEFGIDRFVRACKQRVLRFAARQTEQSIRLGYWMEWDDPEELRKLADAMETPADASGGQATRAMAGRGTVPPVTHNYVTARGQNVTAPAEEIVAQLGNPHWGGSYFTFSNENNEAIWSFLKKCFERGKLYRGHDVMPWSGRGGSAYSQMEVADGRRLTTHRSCFVRFPIRRDPDPGVAPPGLPAPQSAHEYLLVWTTTPWTLTSNVACAVNLDLDYVKLRAKRDGAVYYFAKDNLDTKRLEREFKEGFGGDWSWPAGVPKLKSIAQLFKEQGGYEIEATLKGSEMVGWRYAGPFDDLPAQRDAFREWRPERQRPEESLPHPVIDGGRDSKGNANVVAGEGTGIVHIAPGCGDIDHKIGVDLGLPIIAPLKEDGTYGEGFGPFTGREAIAPGTADLVFEELKRKGYLFYVETYPHIYPHCWRTGDELVFRLVDEWFINMDWRDEIKEVTKAIEWVPASIQGQERELEWLTTMRDWMISKKRFWGLALPIWINPDDPTDFEVIGSLDELRERAVAGWDQFDGHTPHRPWIDAIKIRSQRTGTLLSRIEDVGNPWLDAGIVPFSTMNYAEWKRRTEPGHPSRTGAGAVSFEGAGPGCHSPLDWTEWYPADLVTECFPGQFRNWFYSLLALSTMMRYDETTDPREKRPFKTLLGHRLVMDEHGNAMHKSDGTAIWFEEAAEQLGVDTLRWMYLAHNPASDLRFGLRHKDEPVTLQTAEGPIARTREGLTTCRVTSKPADEVRRQVLIPLWNSYAFFVNYAIADGFDPELPQVPLPERPEIDRWILSRLQELTGTAHTAFHAFDIARFMHAASGYVDDLSNWYIRRNRRRFWRARQNPASTPQDPGAAGQRPATAAAAGGWETDKLAAYQTLYEVLVALTKLLAPCTPFLTERMYQNLVVGSRSSADIGREAGRPSAPSSPHSIPVPESVHLCPYPEVDPSKLDPDLNWRTQQVQTLVRLAHRLREAAEQRVRQPLAELRFACPEERVAAALEQYAEVIADELNVKRVVRVATLGDLVQYSFKPNLKTLGPRYGKLLGVIRDHWPQVDPGELEPLRTGTPVTLTLGGEAVTLAPDDVLISAEPSRAWACGDEGGIQAALATSLTRELIGEGLARDFVRHVQQLRKEAGLDITERIHIQCFTTDVEVGAALEEWSAYVRGETLADGLDWLQASGEGARAVSIGSASVSVQIKPVRGVPKETQ